MNFAVITTTGSAGGFSGSNSRCSVSSAVSRRVHCLTTLYSGEECRPLPKGWPTTGKVLSDRLKRLQPTLAARGVLIDWGRTSAARYIEMTRAATLAPHQQEAAF